MGLVFTLVRAGLRAQLRRTLLATIATMAAVAMVAWVASGYDALLGTFDTYAGKALGRYTVSVAPIATTASGGVPAGALAALRADPAVAVADPMWIARTTMVPPTEAPTGPAPTNEAIVVGLDTAEPPFPLLAGRWCAPTDAVATVVVSAEAAQRWHLAIGDRLPLAADRSQPTIIGVVDTPTMPGGYNDLVAANLLGPAIGQVFATRLVAERIVGSPAVASCVAIAVRPETDLTRFRFGWSPRLSQFATPVQFQEAFAIEEALDQSASATNMRLQAVAATAIAILVAFLVVVSALGMGVSERIRQLALLRAVACTRRQIAALVACEGFAIATAGLVGGLVLAQILLAAAGQHSARVLSHGAALGPRSIVLAVIAAYAAGVLAIILPAWRASRVRPLDALAPAPRMDPGGRGIRRGLLIAGCACVAVNPLILAVLPPHGGPGVMAGILGGTVLLTIGVVLLAPVLVVLADRWLAPVVARLLAVEPRLLACQITSHRWRTVVIVLAMGTSLALVTAVQVWGFTMLGAFIPGPWAPDAVVATRGGGIPPDVAAAVAQIPGVDAQRCQPIVVEQPRLAGDPTGSAEQASIVRQDNIVIVGIDPGAALAGDHPLFAFTWVAGSPATAIAACSGNRGCIVPDHFLRATGLRLGDTITLIPPEEPDHRVRYVIAGAVRLPGWHWQTKLTGFRSRTHRTAALVFADVRTVAADFGFHAPTHVWLSYDRQGPPPDAAALEHAITERWRALVPGAADPAVRVIPVEMIRATVRGYAAQLLWVLGSFLLVTLGITAIGLLNVLLSAIQARRWEMGILRAIGTTRGELVRLVIAEGVLIAAVVAIAGCGLGVLIGWCGVGYSQYISFFGGLHPDLVLPGGPLAIDLAITVTLASLAAIWPAWVIARAHPLALLDRGRATT